MKKHVQTEQLRTVFQRVCALVKPCCKIFTVRQSFVLLLLILGSHVIEN